MATKYKATVNLNTSAGMVRAGDTFPEGVPDSEIKTYLYYGRALPIDEMEIKTTSVEVENRDPKPAKKRGKKSKDD